MTENEAVKYMQIEKECINRDCDRNCAKCDIVQEVDDLNSAYDAAIKALEEVQQYQSIGTHEECKVAMQLYREMIKRKFTIETMEEYMKFEDELLRKNFTFKSLIEATEKQTAKTPILKNVEGVSFVDYADGHGECEVTKWQDWVCPLCGWFVGQRYNRNNHGKIRFHDQRKSNYCNECGQKIDWEGVEN